MSATGWLLVAVGGAVGAAGRYALGTLGDGPERVPWGTVAANLLGSLLLGVLVGLDVPDPWHALLSLGLCGALTTYSAFAVQVHDRGPRVGTLTVLATLPPALALAALGYWVAGSL